MISHPFQISCKKHPALSLFQSCTYLHAKIVIFYFLFQNNMREFIIIVANSKLFPFRHAVYFFPKCLILHIVKINAANLIGPIRLCVRICFHHLTKTASKLQILPVSNVIFQLMAIMACRPYHAWFYFLCIHPFYLPSRNRRPKIPDRPDRLLRL